MCQSLKMNLSKYSEEVLVVAKLYTWVVCALDVDLIMDTQITCSTFVSVTILDNPIVNIIEMCHKKEALDFENGWSIYMHAYFVNLWRWIWGNPTRSGVASGCQVERFRFGPLASLFIRLRYYYRHVQWRRVSAQSGPHTLIVANVLNQANCMPADVSRNGMEKEEEEEEEEEPKGGVFFFFLSTNR